MKTIDLLQSKKISFLLSGFAILSAVVGLLVYLDQKKHNSVQKDILALDKEIKILQLEKLKNGK
jgi:hypothetical protein